MKELIQGIKCIGTLDNIEPNTYFKIYSRINSIESVLSFNGSVVGLFNDYYLPFYQNFDRFDD
jgi:hypothetical protein